MNLKILILKITTLLLKPGNAASKNSRPESQKLAADAISARPVL